MKNLLFGLSIICLSVSPILGVDNLSTNDKDNSSNAQKFEEYNYKMNAEKATQLSSLSLPDSDLQPTGLFVKANAKLNYQIKINNPSIPVESLSTPIITVGVYGDFSKTLNINNLRQTFTLNYNVLSGTVITSNMGLVLSTYYLNNEVTITVTPENPQDVYPINIFNLNDNASEFVQKLMAEDFSDPNKPSNFFTILKSKYSYSLVKSSILYNKYNSSPNLKKLDLNRVLKYLDYSYLQEKKVIGLDANYFGVARSYQYLWAIWDTDTEKDWFQPNRDGVIITADKSLTDTFLDPNFLDNKVGSLTPWGRLWTRLSDKYQNPNYTLDWSKNSVDYYGTYLFYTDLNYKLLPLAHKGDSEAEQNAEMIQKYFAAVKANPSTINVNNANNSLTQWFIDNGQTGYDIDSAWLSFWVQLHDAFGSQLWPTLNQYYRTKAIEKLTTNEQKQDQLVTAIANITKTNLTTFFTTWGFVLSQANKDLMASFGTDNSLKITQNSCFSEYQDRYVDQKGVNNIGNYQQRLFNFSPTSDNSVQSEILSETQTFSNWSVPDLLSHFAINKSDPNLIDNRYWLTSSLKNINNALAFGNPNGEIYLFIYLDHNNNLKIFSNNIAINTPAIDNWCLGIRIKDSKDNVLNTFKFQGKQRANEVVTQPTTIPMLTNYKLEIFAEKNSNVKFTNTNAYSTNSYQSLMSVFNMPSDRANSLLIFNGQKFIPSNSSTLAYNQVPEWMNF